MKYTLNKAAKLSGRAKSTISKTIKDGRLSTDKDDNGGYQIDGSELNRVFPFPVESQTQGPPSNPQGERTNIPTKTDLLALKVTMLLARLDSEQETVSSLRKRLDQMAALTVHRENPDRSKGWLDRLLNR